MHTTSWPYSRAQGYKKAKLLKSNQKCSSFKVPLRYLKSILRNTFHPTLNYFSQNSVNYPNELQQLIKCWKWSFSATNAIVSQSRVCPKL